MAITYVENQQNTGGTTTPAFTNSISGNGGAGSDLIIVFGIGSSSWTSPGFTDNLNTGAYTLLPATATAGSGYGVLVIGYKIVNAGTNVGAGTFTVSQTGTGAQRLAAIHYNGFTQTAQFPAADLAQAFTNSNSSAVISGNFNASFNNEVILAWVTCNSGFAAPIGAAWSVSYTGGVQLNISQISTTTVSSGTSCGVNVTASGATNPWVAQCLGFYDGLPPTPPTLADGTSSSSTTVATGTGGTAMPAISVGQVLDVMLMAETSSALTDSGPSDGSNTYFNIRTFDDHVANGYIWDHWGCIVTVPLASPVISTTWSGGTPTKAAIAVGILPGLIGTNPSTTYSGQNFQTAPSGANSQTANTNTALTSAIYYTIAAWGFSVNQAAAPAAGTSPISFNLVGTVWAALGTGACMTFETQTVQGASATVGVTFTPVAGNTYTFAAAWQNIAGTIIAWIT